jgi:membrane-bound lytic murein transglycosylase B
MAKIPELTDDQQSLIRRLEVAATEAKTGRASVALDDLLAVLALVRELDAERYDAWEGAMGEDL